jgi:hypothetical protein
VPFLVAPPEAWSMIDRADENRPGQKRFLYAVGRETYTEREADCG